MSVHTENGGGLNLFIIEDNEILRLGLRHYLEDNGICICGHIDSQADIITEIAGQELDVILMGMTFNFQCGIEIIKTINGIYNHPILVYSYQDENIYAPRALDAGALGYVMKFKAPHVLKKAIRTVACGELHLSEQIQRRMMKQITECGNQNVDPLDSLTNREFEIFELMASGRTTKQIAARLCLSVKTVQSYQHNMKKKFGIKHLVELEYAAFNCFCGKHNSSH